MLIINECAEFIYKTCPKLAFIHQNGKVLYNTFPDQVVFSIVKRANVFFKQIPVLHIFKKPPMYVYRPTESIILIVSSNLEEDVMAKLFDSFHTRYGTILAKKYSAESLTLNELFELAIFSCARQMGPEQIAYIAKDQNISEEKIYKISMTSLMVLVGEYEGAKERILTFHPFIKEKKLGVIFVFQIEMEKARGNAFDAAILLMTDLSNRSHCYNFHILLEKFMGLCADKISEELINQLSPIDIHGPIPNKSKFEDHLRSLLKDLDSILLETKSSEVIQADMLEALNSLKDL